MEAVESMEISTCVCVLALPCTTPLSHLPALGYNAIITIIIIVTTTTALHTYTSPKTSLPTMRAVLHLTERSV